MATIVAAAGGGNWTSGATWVGGVAPTAADDAQLTLSSGNVTIDAGAVCRSLDCNTYTGTLTHAAATSLTIGDATAGANNIALRLSSGMVYSLGDAATSTVSFVSTSSTQQAITTSTKILGTWTINGVGSSYLLADSNAIGPTATATLLAGTFNTGNQTCSWGSFVFGGNIARTLTLGSSAITISGTATNGFWCSGTTNLTISANTATVTLTSAGGGLVNLAGANMNGTSVVYTTANSQILNGAILKNITFTGTAAKTGALLLSGNITVTGTLTVNGNSATNRIIIWSNIAGTARTITAAIVSVTNVDFMDITGAGSGSWNLSNVPGGVGDCGGNSGITFTTPATQTWSGTSGGNWSTNAWTTRVPLPQDDVVINTVFSAGQTVTADMPRLGKTIDWTGVSGSPVFTIGINCSVFGSLTLTSGISGNVTGVFTITYAGRSNFTITPVGKTFNSSFNISAPGGTYTLMSNMINTAQFSVTNGTFVDGGYNVQTVNFVANTSNTKSLVISGQWTITTNTPSSGWNVASAGTAFSGASSVITFNTGTSSRTFAGGGFTYGTLNYIVAGSTGSLTITGTNTFGTINFSDASNARTLVLPASTTTTILNSFNVQGTGGKLMTISSSSAGVAAMLSKQAGIVGCDYLSIQDSTATGGAGWYAGANSTNVSNNSGWIFTNSSGVAPRFFAFFD